MRVRLVLGKPLNTQPRHQTSNFSPFSRQQGNRQHQTEIFQLGKTFTGRGPTTVSTSYGEGEVKAELERATFANLTAPAGRMLAGTAVGQLSTEHLGVPQTCIRHIQRLVLLPQAVAALSRPFFMSARPMRQVPRPFIQLER